MAKRTTNFGTIRKLPSGRHQARYTHEGQRFAAPSTFTSRAAAAQWLEHEHARMITGQWTPAARADDTPATSLAEYAQQWLATRDLAPRTRDMYRRHLERFISVPVRAPHGAPVDLGRLPLERITPAQVRAWYAAVTGIARAGGTKARTAARERTLHPARVWGRAHGFTVADTGTLPSELMDAWRCAGSPVPVRGRILTPEQAANAGNATISQAYRLLHAILEAAVQDEVISRNPARIKGASSTKARRRSPATPEQVAALAEAFPQRLRVAVLVAAYSGLRYGELFGLQRAHVDLARGVLHVEQSLHYIRDGVPVFGSPKTEASLRPVHLPSFIAAELRTHAALYTVEHSRALMFTRDDGAPVANVYLSQLMRRHRDALGLTGFRWHDLRHTGAAVAYAAGASVPDVQARLGHSTMRAAAIYAHSAEGADANLASRIDDMFSERGRPPARLRAV